jgi:hypothetical protein
MAEVNAQSSVLIVCTMISREVGAYPGREQMYVFVLNGPTKTIGGRVRPDFVPSAMDGSIQTCAVEMCQPNHNYGRGKTRPVKTAHAYRGLFLQSHSHRGTYLPAHQPSFPHELSTNLPYSARTPRLPTLCPRHPSRAQCRPIQATADTGLRRDFAPQPHEFPFSSAQLSARASLCTCARTFPCPVGRFSHGPPRRTCKWSLLAYGPWLTRVTDMRCVLRRSG